MQPGYGNCDTFTGASFPDYTVDLEYLGLFIDKAGSTFACADLDFVGKDAQSCKAALAYTADPAEVLALIEANDESVIALKEAGEFRLQMPEEAESGNYVIAGGDFNQTFSNTDISAYPLQEGVWAPGHIDTSEFSDGWQCLMDPDVPTCRSLDRPYSGADKDTFQYYVIDGFIVSSNIEVQSVETRDLGFENTDHNPVLMECVLK